MNKTKPIPPQPPTKPDKNTDHYIQLIATDTELDRPKKNSNVITRSAADLVQRQAHSDVELPKCKAPHPQVRRLQDADDSNRTKAGSLPRLHKDEPKNNKAGTLPTGMALMNPNSKSPTGKRSPAFLYVLYFLTLLLNKFCM